MLSASFHAERRKMRRARRRSSGLSTWKAPYVLEALTLSYRRPPTSSLFFLQSFDPTATADAPTSVIIINIKLPIISTEKEGALLPFL